MAAREKPDHDTQELNISDILGSDTSKKVWGDGEMASRPVPDDLAPHPDLPDDSRLWAALQDASGGTWGGCVFDV